MIIFDLGTSLTPSASLPSKPAIQLNRTALTGLGLKGLPVKSDALSKASAAAAVMDDFAESGRKLVKLGEMPAIDLAVDVGAASIGENLEADDDEDEQNSGVDVVMKDAEEEEEEEEVDPLDAFMTDVTQAVKKVNAEDRAKLKGTNRMPIDGAREEGGDSDDDDSPAAPDDMDATNMRPEDILAWVQLQCSSPVRTNHYP